MAYYSNLPASPENLTSQTVLIRLIDSIGYRFQLASSDLSDNIGEFRTIESAMNIRELMQHIYQLLYWSATAFDKSLPYQKFKEVNELREASLKICEHLSQSIAHMSINEIKNISIYLKRNDTYYPIWYMINGPLSDILTHIGQLNSWRRMAGNPCPRISPFTGLSY
jgi:hypothetical protein